MRKLLLNSNGKALVGSNGKAYAVDVDVLSGDGSATFQAAAGKILRLLRYGKCTQAGTPTPSSPVDIVCNNGALRMVDDELPRSYKRITGIKFDGDFWYETGEVLNGDDAVTMTLANTAASGQNVFGSYNGTSSGTKNFSLYIYGGDSNNKSYYRYGEQLLRPRFGENERTITISGNGTDGFAKDATAKPDTFTTEAPAYIGTLPHSSSHAYTGSIMGSIDVVNNGQLRLRWIPCERQSDGAIGYYELKSGTFLEQVGTGAPVKGGYDTSHMTEFIIDGTPEVISIGGQVASVQNLFQVGDYKDEQDIVSGRVTRRVGVKVLDGTENFIIYSDTYIKSDATNICLVKQDSLNAFSDTVICTHLIATKMAIWQTVGFPNCIVLNGNHQIHFNIDNILTGVNYETDDRVTALTKIKTWLASQYAAGTPVIVLYPLVKETKEEVGGQTLNTVDGSNTVTTAGEFKQLIYKI